MTNSVFLPCKCCCQVLSMDIPKQLRFRSSLSNLNVVFKDAKDLLCRKLREVRLHGDYN